MCKFGIKPIVLLLTLSLTGSISASDASSAARNAAADGNLPVPTINRDRNSRPAMINLFDRDGSTSPCNYTLYEAKIWDTGTLIRHFIPIKAGETINGITATDNGLFDKVKVYCKKIRIVYSLGPPTPKKLCAICVICGFS